MFLWAEWQEHKGSGALNITKPQGHMVQGQYQDPTTIVGVPSSLESGFLKQGPPECQSVSLACVLFVKPAWPAHEDRLLSNSSENPGGYSFISFWPFMGSPC